MRGLLAALCLAATTAPALAQQCSIEYQRADNMLAAAGRPDGSLGKETLTLQAAETRVFNTDWKYEKQRTGLECGRPAMPGGPVRHGIHQLRRVDLRQPAALAAALQPLSSPGSSRRWRRSPP
jgi:hypothetical protein